MPESAGRFRLAIQRLIGKTRELAGDRFREGEEPTASASGADVRDGRQRIYSGSPSSTAKCQIVRTLGMLSAGFLYSKGFLV